MVYTQSWLTEAAAVRTEDLIATRRTLHRRPELGFQEIRTAELVARRLGAIPGVEQIRTGVGKTGVTALIRGGRSGPTLLLRADIDALPILEETGAEYASTVPGVMHACGHDGHTAVLLTVAAILAEHREHWAGTALLVFQPAEEILTGAQAMIDDGVLGHAGSAVSATLGLHLANWLPVGQVGIRVGPSFAAVDKVTITVTGKGGHGAMPHLAVDPVYTAAQMVLSLQQILSREISPLDRAVLSICQIVGGSAFNIIPETVTLIGTVRTFDMELRARIARRIEEIASGVAAAGSARATVQIEAGPPPVVNAQTMCDVVYAAATAAIGQSQVVTPDITMGGDDVALFLNAAPGCYFLVGTRDSARGFDAPHHHPRFDIAEEGMVTAVTVFAAAALCYLGSSLA
jgi:amidohydrolase